MLRVLQDRTFEVLGSSQRREVDVRVVSATNRALADMVARGEFREDLLYRINLITIHLPPLRERPDDIPILASPLPAGGDGQPTGRESLALTPAAARWLQAQPWPGNVRQLQQWVERAVLVEHPRPARRRELHRSAARRRAATPPIRCPTVGAMTMDEIERAMIVKSLRHHGGNISRVAESLGLSRAGALSPLREVRDHRVSFRARLRHLPRRGAPGPGRPRRLAGVRPSPTR